MGWMIGLMDEWRANEVEITERDLKFENLRFEIDEETRIGKEHEQETLQRFELR